MVNLKKMSRELEELNDEKKRGRHILWVIKN